jgi:hypothetical protein
MKEQTAFSSKSVKYIVLMFMVLLVSTITTTNAALSSLQKQQILQAFNLARSTTKVPAANMKKLEWDDVISSFMQNYTNKCSTDWQEFNDPPMYFAYRDRAADPVGVAKWRTLRMAPYYNIETGGCTNTTMSRKICRNPEIYERLIVANIERVGCGYTRCGRGPKNVYHACSIAKIDLPPSSDRTVFPFIRAASNDLRCSQCPVGWQGGCVNGLCTRSI